MPISLALGIALGVAGVVSGIHLPIRDFSSILPPPSHPARGRHFRRLQAWSTAAVSRNLPFAAASSPIVRPTDFGADPTGKNDSSAAFKAAMSEILARNSTPNPMADGVRGLGGATLDLEGGIYKISSPLVFPPYTGNFAVVQGTLLASDSFPASNFLIEVGDSSCSNQQHSCNEFAMFEGIFFDANNNTAAGGLHISATMGATVRSCFFKGYAQAGVQVDGGHEVFVSESWFGEWYYGDERKANYTASTGDGIVLNGNDHVVDDVIVFSARVGVVLNGAANLVKSTHTWNLATHLGGIGMRVVAGSGSQNRIVSSYFDFNDLVVEDPHLLVVTGGFFLGGGQLLLKSVSSGAIHGLVVTGNEWYDTSLPTIAINDSSKPFATVVDTSIHSNLAPASASTGGSGIKMSSSTQTVSSTSAASNYTIDFSSALFLPCSQAPIQHTLFSITTPSPTTSPPSASASIAPDTCTVTINVDPPTAASVTIQVDQSMYST